MVSGAVPHRRALKRIDSYEIARQLGDPILRQPAREVTVWNDRVHRIGLRLKTTVMHDPKSVGMAAPQLGIPYRIVAYRDTTNGLVHVITNPVLFCTSSARVYDVEGCFSVRQGMVKVWRAYGVEVHGCDLRGSPVEVQATGLAARCLQHELDHLDGKMIVDYGPILTQAEVVSYMEEAKKEAAENEAVSGRQRGG